MARFDKADILALIAQVDELEQQLNADDIGHLQMGYTEEELVEQAKAIIKEINGGLASQTGFTRAQLIVMSDGLVDQFNAQHGTSLSREDVIEKADGLVQSVNKKLDDETREAECFLTGLLDAIQYHRAATMYADAGMAAEARKCLAGARYWLPRILEHATK